MLIKCKCQHCSQNIEFDSISAGADVACPHCGMETKLFIPTARLPESMFKNKSEAQPPPNPVDAHLKSIRAASSYHALRSIINVCFYISMALLAVAFLCLCIGHFVPHSSYSASVASGPALMPSGDNSQDSWLYFIAGCGTMALAVVVLVALRQSAFLLIDIADTLLHEHSRK